jgi:hypothetical protein
MNDTLENTITLTPIIDDDNDNTTNDLTDDSINEEEINKEDEKEDLSNIPDCTQECSFSIDDDDDIPDEDIQRMLFLFCVNEDIPIHYKQLLGKVIKKKTYKKNEKLFIFNMIGYIWQKAKQNEDLTKTQKVIIIRRIYKLLFDKFDD